jgi:hypothetical protein
MPPPTDRIRALVIEAYAELCRVVTATASIVGRAVHHRCAQALLPSARVVVNAGEVARCLEPKPLSALWRIVRLDTRTRVTGELAAAWGERA